MARTRSRKRRPAGARPAPAGTSERAGAQGSRSEDAGAPTTTRRAESKATSGTPPTRAKLAARAGRERTGGERRRSPAASTYGERPRSPWHPLPLSELLILVGAVAVILGMRKLDTNHPSISQGGDTLLAGLVVVGLGAFEVALREHRSGYRSHTVMLAALPVLVFHSLVVLGVSAFTTAPRLLNVGLFAVDIALFAFLFRLLRAHFLDGRHARVLRGR